MTSQPACRYSRCTRRTASGFSISARVPHSGSSSASLAPAACGSSVPTPPSRITQRCSAIDRASVLIGARRPAVTRRRPPCSRPSAANLSGIRRYAPARPRGARAPPRRPSTGRGRGPTSKSSCQASTAWSASSTSRKRSAASRSSSAEAAGEPALAHTAHRQVGLEPGIVEQPRRARPDQGEGGGAVRAVGAVDGGAGDDRVAHDARPARGGAPGTDRRSPGRARRGSTSCAAVRTASPGAGARPPSDVSRKCASHGSGPAISSASRSERTARPTRLTQIASSVAAEPKWAATAWPSRSIMTPPASRRRSAIVGQATSPRVAAMAVDASPARWGFRLPMGRSCPPLREGPLGPVFRPPSRLASCGRGAPAEHPTRTDRDGARARAQARRELRARAGPRAPRAGGRGGRARVAGGAASATIRRPSPASTPPSIWSSRTCARGTRVTVHGDYDVDGVCSTAILVRALRSARRRRGLVPAQPHRGRLRAQRGDGRAARRARHAPAAHRRLRHHGDRRGRAGARSGPRRRRHRPSQPARRRLAARGADRASRRLRLPVPRPVRGRCRLQVRRPLLLSGAGRDPAGADEDLDLVALATVADCVPLRDENRRLVREGLHALATSTKPGIRALLRVAKVDPGALDARAIGFRLAPRINAAGRLYRADAGLELVLTDDAERAAAIADELDHANAERRLTETRILFEAEAQVRELGEQPAYVLAGEGWHPGVIGIVASRIAERHHRPCVMLAHGRRRGDRLGALDPGLRPAGRARRERRAPAAPRRAPRGGGLHDRARGRSTPSGPPSSRTRRRSWRRRTSCPPSASTPWWRATSSGWRWPRSSSGWRPSGSPTRRCRCSCRPRGWSTRARWARRAATCASRSRPAATAPGRSPSG